MYKKGNATTAHAPVRSYDIYYTTLNVTCQAFARIFLREIAGNFSLYIYI